MKKHKLLANKKNPENAREAVKTVGGKLKSRGGKLVPISYTMINHEKNMIQGEKIRHMWV